jgi:nitroimidazol reductase NimA-like FMN-containing flavoprotein (pyridoxamine 5'-phosphate oxidase superfamily)
MRRQDREVTDTSAILAIIEAADSCRLGMIDDTGSSLRPYLVALNFGFEPKPGESPKGTFWFHCARDGHKLDLLKRNAQVCIQLDCQHEPVINGLGCGWGMKYASVFAEGCAVFVNDPTEQRHGLDQLMAHYRRLWGVPSQDKIPGDYDDKVLAKTTIFRVDVVTLTAKRKS